MVTEKFRTILEKEKVKELIPFLKTLSKEDKKELTSPIKDLAKEYLEYKSETSLMGGTTFKQKATPVQKKILYAAAFVCMNRKDNAKLDQFGHMLNRELLLEILPWYCPDWFSDSINDLTKLNWFPVDVKYDFVMDLAEKGYLRPTDELIVRLLPQMIFDVTKAVNDHQFSFDPKLLIKREITLREHIWLIFQYETGINHSDRFVQYNGPGKEPGKVELRWSTSIKTFVDEGRIDRSRLLKECILASARNFNKGLSGWFIDLFEFLKPTQAELISLQPELYIALNSQHSKAVNAVLDSLKEIVDAKEFNVNSLMENAPLLLSSETKSVVSSALLLLEKIARKQPAQKEQACIVACHAFIHSDENIQNKASKIVLKFHEGSPLVVDEINKYSDSMLMSSKKALAEFLEARQPAKEESKTEAASAVVNPLPEIQTLDELIFLASQAFDNNDPLHFDLLPAALVKLQGQLTESALPKFEPALQRAFNVVMGDWPATMGYLDHLLATFFIDLTWLLAERSPVAGASLKAIHSRFRLKEEENKEKWSWYTGRISELTGWRTETKDTTYIIHKTILIVAYQKIKDRELVPILSTPTHDYGYIDPHVLVERLHQYQVRNILPENYDFQVAISRIAPFHHQKAVTLARETLKGETLKIVEFLLTKEADPVPPFTTPSLWFMAGVTKTPQRSFGEFDNLYYSTLPKSIFTGDVPWKSFNEHYKITRYNFQKKQNEEVPAEQKVLRLQLNPPVDLGESNTKEGGVLSKLSKLFAPRIKKSSRTEVHTIYELLSMRAKFLSAEPNDIQRFISLFPNNPNPILALITSKSLVFGTFTGETHKRMVIKAFEGLVNLKFPFSEITHLFVATSLLTSDKTVRSFAAEMWISAVNSNSTDSVLVGHMIGAHLGAQYAPLKRFTDIVSTNLINISPLHNRELEKLLSATLPQLPSEETPVGMKRLLELYSEVLAVNNSTVGVEEIRSKLSGWSSSPSLKKVISSLIPS